VPSGSWVDRLLWFSVFLGVLAVCLTLALLLWLGLHPDPVWPEFDLRDGGTVTESCYATVTSNCQGGLATR
jgi:hypothetical protein